MTPIKTPAGRPAPLPSVREPAPQRTSRTDATALALLGAMFLALAIVGSVSLTANASETFHDIMHTIGLGRSSVIEAEQQRQAAAIADLSRSLQAIANDIGKTVDHRDLAVSDRFALMDADIAALVAQLRAVRADTGQLQVKVADLDATVIATRNQLGTLDHALGGPLDAFGTLRSSLDEHAAGNDRDIAALTSRLDRLEHMATRDLTGAIKTSVVRKKQVRRRPRP